MEKIRLELEALEIDTFEAESPVEERGTVRAHSDICETQRGAWTCRGFWSCDPWYECEGTVVDATCVNVTGC